MPIPAMPSRRLLEELHGATLESRLEEMGVLRSFSMPRVSYDNPLSESLFRERRLSGQGLAAVHLRGLSGLECLTLATRRKRL
jgi:transposase InsO family protein